MQKIVLKIGGSIISEKNPEKLASFPLSINEIKKRGEAFMKIEGIRRIAREIKEAVDEGGVRLILVNGAGPFGHLLVKKNRPDEDVRASVRFQNERLVSELRAAGIDAVPVPPSESVSFENGKFNIDYLWEIVEMLLEEGKTPSTYGDVLKNGKIISGDDLAVLLAEKWHADKIIAATDVAGVFTRDPKIYEDAEFIKYLRSGTDQKTDYTINCIDVTGGMASKVKKLKLAAENGMGCQIISGMKENNIKMALLSDEILGTSIVPSSDLNTFKRYQ